MKRAWLKCHYLRGINWKGEGAQQTIDIVGIEGILLQYFSLVFYNLTSYRFACARRLNSFLNKNVQYEAQHITAYRKGGILLYYFPSVRDDVLHDINLCFLTISLWTKRLLRFCSYNPKRPLSLIEKVGVSVLIIRILTETYGFPLRNK